MSMTFEPAQRRFSVSGGSAHAPARLRRWAVGLARAAVVAIVIGVVPVTVSYAVGRANLVEDNWLGFLSATMLIAGLLASLAGFVLAVAAKVSHERWLRLWLPLSIFPTLVGLLALGEAILWE